MQPPAPGTPEEAVDRLQAAAEHRVEPARLELPPTFTTCPGCSGTGKQSLTCGWWAALYPDCWQCMGTGRAWILADPPRVVQPPAVPGECEDCAGHGVRDFPTRLCTTCAGTGRDSEASVLSEAALIAVLSSRAYDEVRSAIGRTHPAGWSVRDVMTSCRTRWTIQYPGEIGAMMVLLHRAQEQLIVSASCSECAGSGVLRSGCREQAERVQHVRDLCYAERSLALGFTRSGHPRHPLYLRADAPLRMLPLRP